MPQMESSDPDEDDAVIAAFEVLAQSRPGLLLILAPRRPERFEVAAEKLKRRGIAFVRRSSLDLGGADPLVRAGRPRPVEADQGVGCGPGGPPHLVAVLLLDSMGELAALFERATVVFMGGTLASRGGHNILEPAYFAKPVIAGPHMENFSCHRGGILLLRRFIRISGADELASAVTRLLDHPEEARAAGNKAREMALAKRGAVASMVGEILKASGEVCPILCEPSPRVFCLRR